MSERLLADRYALEEKVADGALGVVYSARDVHSKQLVAVKIAKIPDGEAGERYRAAFKRETRALMMVDHPGVLRILFAGEDAVGSPYVVTERLTGADVAAIIERHGALSESAATLIADHALAALEAAHERGVVHGDLQPQNLFLCESGRVVILDFGLARADWLARGQTLAQRVDTQLIGVPHYLAPEQLGAGHADARSDLYALGASLFHALSGAPPFAGKTPLEVFDRLARNERRPLREAAPAVAEPLAAAVEALMAAAPADRPQSATAARALFRKLAGAISEPIAVLENALGNERTQIFRDTSRPRAPTPEVTARTQLGAPSRWWIGVVFLVLVAGAAVLIVRPAKTPVSPPPPIPVTELPPLEQPSSVEVPAVPAVPPVVESEARTVTVKCSLAQWAEITIDDKPRGRFQHATRFELSPGKHELVFKNPIYPEQSVKVNLRRATAIDVDFKSGGAPVVK